ncbi:MAG: DEAD/DEAH box helicase [Promethearchaeota archaeon]
MSFKEIEPLHLTYIPSIFWNSSLSGFKLLNTSSNLPKNADFFIFWTESLNSEVELSTHVKYYFPQIPIEKLLTCRINLVKINQIHQEKKENKKKSSKATKYLRVRPTITKIIPIIPGIKILYKINLQEEAKINGIPLSNSIKTYSLLTKLIFELLSRGSFIPILKEKKENLFEGRWHLLLKTELDTERFNLIVKNSRWQAFNLPVNIIEVERDPNARNHVLKSEGTWHPRYLFSIYLDNIGNYLIKYFLNKRNFRYFTDYYGHLEKQAARGDLGVSNWGYKFLKSVIKVDAEFPIIKFHETIIPNIIKNWTKFSRILSQKERNVVFNVHLELPEKDGSEDTWPLRFSLNIRDKKKNYGIQELMKEKEEVYLNHLSQSFDSRESFIEYILTSFGLLSKIIPPIKKELEKEIPEKIYLTTSEAMNFMKMTREILIQSGFNVIVPEAFRKGGAQRLFTRLVILSPSKKKKERKSSQQLPSLFTVSSLLQYKWELLLEGKELTPAQKEIILNAKEPLVNIDGKWILIEEEDFKKINNLMSNKVRNELGLQEDGTINYLAALKLGLSGEVKLPENEEPQEVIIEGDLNEILKRLRETKEFSRIDVPSSFNGTLRDYQKIGLNWLANLCDLNFGVCLADDMGLGKTIQIIAYLLYRKERFPHEQGAILIICPTSVLFNWQKELEKFAPTLSYIIHHGPDRISSLKELKEYTKSHLIILTTYATVRNDIELLETITYQGIIVDESQNIKNYAAKQTQAIHRLISNYRIGLSGTPIENRLLELWTLFEFLNPGLLGNKLYFQKNYVIPIERYHDKEALQNLKALISPFMLRRMKSDKSIIKDLPEKNEIKIYIKLTELQIALYENLVKEILEKMESLKGMKNKMMNLILALLVKLKQICNHPYQFLKKEEIDVPIQEFISQSNKLKRLVEMTEEIISNGEKILIFTQFKKMGDLICKVFEHIFPFKILFFHGSIPEKKRKELVEEFQSASRESAPIMILSLKAGGIGLNLTRGTTVIHFDRWWNPSVEQQATDRAYRIGQKQPVNVYKFITAGTIEEKIDALLEEKKELTEKIMTSTSERWLAELDMEKFKELIMFKE